MVPDWVGGVITGTFALLGVLIGMWLQSRR